MTFALWLMLNPSTADSFEDDQTVSNIIQRTSLWAGSLVPPECKKSAIISGCGRYRWELRRWWQPGQVDMLLKLPPPLPNVHGLIVGNLYAYRATDPQELLELSIEEAIGADTDTHLRSQIAECELVICAWGNGPWSLRSPAHRERASAVLSMVRAAGKIPYMLERTKADMPRHPLYFPMGKPFVPWD